MELGIVVWQTDAGVGIVEVAHLVEQAGCESLFVVGHSHIPASRHEVIEQPGHESDAHLLDQFTALGAAAAVTQTTRSEPASASSPNATQSPSPSRWRRSAISPTVASCSASAPAG